MNQVIYQAYSPAHSYLKKALPYCDLLTGETKYKTPKVENVPRENIKLFNDEYECLKYCVKNGLRYEEVNVE